MGSVPPARHGQSSVVADSRQSVGSPLPPRPVAGRRVRWLFVLLLVAAYPVVIERILIYACGQGKVEVARTLLRWGGSVNARAYFGETPLIAAARAGSERTVSVLLQQGAIVDSRLGDGRTALDMACEEGHVGVVRMLLTAGADPNPQEGSGWSPLHSAAGGSANPTIVRLLLRAGADPFVPDYRGRTPRIRIFWDGKPEIQKLLLDAEEAWVSK